MVFLENLVVKFISSGIPGGILGGIPKGLTGVILRWIPWVGIPGDISGFPWKFLMNSF